MKAKTKEKIIVIAILLAMAFILFSCEVWHLGYVHKHPDKFQFVCSPDSIIKTESSDTAITFENDNIVNPDSFWVQLFQHCSEDNKVITDSAKINNQRIALFKDSVFNALNKINYKYSFNLKNGILQLKIKQDSIKQLKEIITIRDKTIIELSRTKPQPPVIDKSGRNWWRNAFFILIVINLLISSILFIRYKIIGLLNPHK